MAASVTLAGAPARFPGGLREVAPPVRARLLLQTLALGYELATAG